MTWVPGVSDLTGIWTACQMAWSASSWTSVTTASSRSSIGGTILGGGQILVEVGVLLLAEVGEVDGLLNDPFALVNRLALDPAGKASDDVLVEPELLDAGVSDRVFDQNQTEHRLGGLGRARKCGLG